MTKITIHRALTELKTLGDRILKAIDSLEPVAIGQKDKKIGNMYTVEEYNKEAVASYKSVEDLLDRRVKIKTAIVNSNAVTKVKVGDLELTVAEAITAKSYITEEKRLLETLRSKLSRAKAGMEKNNAAVDTQSVKLAEVTLNKAGIKVESDEAQAVIKPYLDANYFSLIDPLKIEEKIKALELKISNFEAEVDAALSETNAITTIEV